MTPCFVRVNGQRRYRSHPPTTALGSNARRLPATACETASFVVQNQRSTEASSILFGPAVASSLASGGLASGGR